MATPTSPQDLPRRGWSDAPWRGLQELLHGPPGVVAMDWDETATRGDISYLLLADLDERQPGVWAALQERIAGDRLLGYRELALLIQTGRTEAEVAAWTRAVAERALARGELRWVSEIRDLTGALHAAGWGVYVVTGSPTPVVAALAREYGIPHEHVIGMGAVPGPDGRFLPELLEPVTWREGKAARFRARVGTVPTLALGDSEGDVALLASAHHAVWIDHGDPVLRTAALARGWWRQEGW